MQVCLAGVLTTGNTKRINEMQLYLASGMGSRADLAEELKRGNGDDHTTVDFSKLKVLESYYYLRSKKQFLPLIAQMKAFLLDSGAFTFLQHKHNGRIDWDKYVEEYAKFINDYDVRLFFELDIDSLLGIKEVEWLRAKLERLTGKQPIPVWHKNRGKEGFLKMCREYPYVALGGIASKEIPTELYKKAFPWFIRTAHQHGCKIHGLGFTQIVELPKYKFDSVDSTAWIYGNIGGYVYKFIPSKGEFEKYFDKTKRLKTKAVAKHNLQEWIKYSSWAEDNL